VKANVGTLEADLFERVFRDPSRGSARRIGAEVEFIPVDATTGQRCAIESQEQLSSLPFLRSYGAPLGWMEGLTSKGTPCFGLREGGTLTFEPGGQLEYSSPPCSSASNLLRLLQSVVPPLRAAASDEGIDLLTIGIDPYNSADQAPMLIHASRYERMAEYLARKGPEGARMMRQTAAFQVSLDFDDEPWLRWRVLNAAAPFMVAIFANSPVYAGECSGHQSTRAHVWRKLDPLRTGIPYDAEAPVQAYLDFAMNAPAILFPNVDGEYRPFGEWLSRSTPTDEEWQEHLSTLFPEVRPRGHLELRSPDAVAPEWYAAPLAVTSGILYDPAALRAADEILPHPDPGLLERAGRLGLHDEEIARTAANLFQVALAGCTNLGARYFHPAHIELAGEYFNRYTRRGLSPSDEILQDARAA